MKYLIKLPFGILKNDDIRKSFINKSIDNNDDNRNNIQR